MPTVSKENAATFAELEGGVYLGASPVAVLPGPPDLRDRERSHPVVLYCCGPHAKPNEPGIVSPAGCPQAAQVTLDDNLLQLRQVARGDEVVEGGIRDDLPDVFPPELRGRRSSSRSGRLDRWVAGTGH